MTRAGSMTPITMAAQSVGIDVAGEACLAALLGLSFSRAVAREWSRC